MSILRKINVNGESEKEFFKSLKNRTSKTDEKVTKIVQEIIYNVEKNGDNAIIDYTKKFDCPNPEYYEVPREVINEALTNADKDFVHAILDAQENITKFHQREISQGFIDAQPNGVIMGQKVRGLDKVGLYVPGGTAAYPSSVLMNAIPAKIAGVKEIIMVTPPLKNGKPNNDILVSAAVCGVNRIFMAGGAQAIAALAFGTEQIPKVDKIVGPGNIFVATAKRLLFGTVDIDMIAGPSEVLVMADEKANPKYVAADLMSQAEHDRLASAILVTTSEKFADKVDVEIKRQVQNLSRKEIILDSMKNQGAVLIVNSREEACDIANKVAPEHLEVHMENPVELLGSLENAGSIFLGEYASEPLGDYFAGPNHVLPTSGTARFFSPLGVYSFIKRTSYTYYTRDALKNAKDEIELIANKEGLTAHANAIAVRFE